jgi:hypothetical protein
MRYFLAAVVITLSLGLSPLATAAEAPQQTAVVGPAWEMVESFFDQVRAVLSLDMDRPERPRATGPAPSGMRTVTAADGGDPAGDMGPGMEPNG